MVSNRVIILLFVLLLLPFSAHAEDGGDSGDDSSDTTVVVVEEDGPKLEVTINTTNKVTLLNVPTVGRLEVYSILGVKIKSINLNQCADGCFIDLSKGFYILKAGKSTQKVIVR